MPSPSSKAVEQNFGDDQGQEYLDLYGGTLRLISIGPYTSTFVKRIKDSMDQDPLLFQFPSDPFQRRICFQIRQSSSCLHLRSTFFFVILELKQKRMHWKMAFICTKQNPALSLLWVHFMAKSAAVAPYR